MTDIAKERYKKRSSEDLNLDEEAKLYLKELERDVVDADTARQ